MELGEVRRAIDPECRTAPLALCLDHVVHRVAEGLDEAVLAALGFSAVQWLAFIEIAARTWNRRPFTSSSICAS